MRRAPAFLGLIFLGAGRVRRYRYEIHYTLSQPEPGMSEELAVSALSSRFVVRPGELVCENREYLGLWQTR